LAASGEEEEGEEEEDEFFHFLGFAAIEIAATVTKPAFAG
jgi:hypothetical protein